MKTSELTDALLDYWTARAEGIPAEQLAIRLVPRTEWTICVHMPPDLVPRTLAYSTAWAQGGPLIEKHSTDIFFAPPTWHASIGRANCSDRGAGDTPLQALCRAIVRASFGGEVEELPCAC